MYETFFAYAFLLSSALPLEGQQDAGQENVVTRCDVLSFPSVLAGTHLLVGADIGACAFLYYLKDLGLKASFRPSPIKLIERIVNVITRAGGIHIHGFP